MRPWAGFIRLTLLLLLLQLGGRALAAPVVNTNVTTALGPNFFFDSASTGGGDHSDTVFIRDMTGNWASNSTVTIKGLGWASSSAGTVANEVRATLTDFGADGVFGTSDDVVVGVVVDALVFQGVAGEYGWLFDTGIVFRAVSGSMRIRIEGFNAGVPAVINRKTTSGSTAAAVKLSVAGEAISDSPPLTYTLIAGNELWPADKRAAIVTAMNEGVAHYNAHGYFPKALTVNYDTNVPTANGSYSGRINFGGQISTRTAIHEIAHTLGVGTVGAWSTYSGTGNWTGARAIARIQLYDGATAVIGCDTQHFWPYGLNQANEDTYLARIRNVRMVAALRWDMGIVTDSDADGLPDDWERFYFRTLAYSGGGDFDADGETNLAEYNADTDPRDGISALTTTLVVNNASGGGQTTFNYGPAILSAYFGASAVSPNALINSASLTYLGVNSSAFPSDGNVNAINDRDGAVGGADQERLRIACQSRHGLARLTWQWSRADGPLATDGVTISGFTSDPQAVFSGGIGAPSPIYNAGKLTFQISTFNATVHTVTFANPAASSNATLEITVADSTQAGAQFALMSLRFKNLNRPPVAPVIPLNVSLGASATANVLAGSPAPSDPEADALSLVAAGPAAHGQVSFTSTQATYTSTNIATTDSFNYVVQDALGGRATNVVMVTLLTPAEFNRISAPTTFNESFRFGYRGLALQNYVVERTAELPPVAGWTPVFTNMIGVDGWLWFTNFEGGNQNFFRVRRPP